MTFLVERLAELRRHLDHLALLRPRVATRAVLERDLSLHNDVLFSLLTVSQLVIDIAGELAARRGYRFEDYTEAVRLLSRDARFPSELVSELERLPGFRSIVIHEYVALDLDRVLKRWIAWASEKKQAAAVRAVIRNFRRCFFGNDPPVRDVVETVVPILFRH